MKKVLVFGTFDILHEGHKYFLKEAKKLGKSLIVVIARDKTVQYVKGIIPKHDENERLENVKMTKIPDKVVLGSETDYYSILSDVKPDVIALGYDQHHFVSGLDVELEARGLKNTKIIRVLSHEPHKYKSSLMRKK